MRVVESFEAGASLLAGGALIVVVAGVLIAEPNQASRNDAGQTRTGLSGLLSRTFWSGVATPDVGGSVYGGYTTARNSDVILQQPNGTDMIVKDVSWNSEPDKMPPYHGFRGTWWFPPGRSLGAMADLVYVKVVADRDRKVRQSGMRDGISVPEIEPASATFRRLEFTDGLNLLTGSIIYRMPFSGGSCPMLVSGRAFHCPMRKCSAEEAPLKKPSPISGPGLRFTLLPVSNTALRGLARSSPNTA